MKLPRLIAALYLSLGSVGALAQGPPVYVVSTVAGSNPSGDGGPATAALLFSPRSVRTDAAGNIYFADNGNNRIRKVAPDGTITTVFGTGAPADTNLAVSPTQSAISIPTSIAFDKAGNLFVGHLGEILKISGGTITVVAGGGAATADGVKATSALIAGRVFDIVFDAGGNLYFTEGGSQRVRKIDPDGVITTIAGSSSGFGGDGGPATASQLTAPRGLAIDSHGNIYIADSMRVRKITTDGKIATIAGTGGPGGPGDGGPATAATFAVAYSLAIGVNDVLYVSDIGRQTIRKITSDGVIDRVAGAGQGFAGDTGPALQALLDNPLGLTFDSVGNLYFADSNNDRIRKISTTGVITTVAGASHFSGENVQATAAQLYRPGNPATDALGNIYFADNGNHRVRKISVDGVITTVAGNGLPGYSGDNGPATAASLNHPNGVAVDNRGNLYIADITNGVIRKVTAAGIISTYAGDPRASKSGDGGPATAAALIAPEGVALDPAGNLFIADALDNRVRKVTPDGKISTVAGTGIPGKEGDNGPGTAATISFPLAVATDQQGNVYIADAGNSRIRKVTPAGLITTIAGTGTSGVSGDGGPATAAPLADPSSIAVDGGGNIYITDDVANNVRRISGAGIIDTIAGGTAGYSGDGGPATSAAFNRPVGIAVDRQGSVIVTDTYNQVIRKLTFAPPSALSVVAVVNGASFVAGSVAPGSLISIFGTGFASPPVGAVDTPLPTTLGDLTVKVNGTAIPILFANASQINAQLPYEIAPGAATVIVTKTTGAGQPFPFTVSAAAPGIFQPRQGRAIAQNQDGTVNDTNNPASVGSVMVLYFTGQGQSDNPILTGSPAPESPLARPLGSANVTIGGQPSELIYLGVTPGFIGLSQVNVRIPALPAGDQPVIITIGSGQSIPALISVK